LDSHRVAVDLDLKRLLARLNLQLRRLVEGGQVVAERLMVDALYYVGRSDEKVARVAEIKRLYGLDALIPADFERATLTAVDPDALAALREALAQAKVLWGQLVTSTTPNPTRYRQEIESARAASARLQATPMADVLAQIGHVTDGFVQLSPAVRERLGLEVASALLFVETGADQLPQLDPEFGERARKVAERLSGAARGQELPEAGPWLSELARRAQDRLSMGTVVTETQATLREIEQRLDRFFRNPALREELIGVGPLVDQVCGVMSILGHEEPVAALRNVQQSVAHFVDGSAPATQDEFSRIAQNLGAIGFFVETLAQDGARPRGMFRYDPASGLFSADLAQFQAAGAAETGGADDIVPPYALEDRVPAVTSADNVEAAAQQRLERVQMLAERLAVAPEDRAIQQQIGEVLGQLAHDADLLDSSPLRALTGDATRLLGALVHGGGRNAALELLERLTPSKPAVPQPTAPMPVSQSEAARELHEIFIGEGTEVLDSIVEHLGFLRAQPQDLGLMTTVRRGFHTLKGSGRMVGLKNFADGAWAVEQCFNVWLAQERPATRDLLELAHHANDQMREWLRAVANDPNAAIDAEPMIRMARAIRESGSLSAAGHAIPDLMAGLAPPKGDGGAETQESPTLPISAAPEDEFELTPAGDEPVAEPGLQIEESGLDALAAPGAGFDEDGPQTVLPIEFGQFGAHRAAPIDPAEQLAELVGLARIERAGLYEAPSAPPVSDQTRRIGEIEISHGLYSVFLNEADEATRALAQDIGEWRYEPERAISTATVRCAHSLAGITATVGLEPVRLIADPLEHLMHELAGEHGLAPALTASQFDVLDRAIEQIRGMLHQFAAGEYPEPAPLEASAVDELLGVVRAQIEHRHDQAMNEAPATELVMVASPESEPLESEPEGEPQIEASAVDEFAAAPAIEPQVDAAPADAFESAPAVPTPAFAPHQHAAPAASVAPPPARVTLVPSGGTPLRDELDPDLLHVFVTEAHDLLPAIGIGLRSLAVNPNDREVARDLMRHLHTVKGSARMAGAMRLGELVHEMETRIEAAMQLVSVPAVVIEDLQGQFDHALSLFDDLHAPSQPTRTIEADATALEPEADDIPYDAQPTSAIEPVQAAREAEAEPGKPAPTPATAATAPFIRVRADVLDRLVDHAGEVSIARSKLETEVGTLRGSLTDLTENIQRLRAQLREVEIQADAQIQARSDQLARESATFDPLEFDRFSRLQELTRMLAESVE
ncbi:MAG TPA: Hpt domain-containing protein, partial [Burkholderiaceae bacterium]|nr:Hpt domain-containing protein [Burkholderiaceae bacterium]